MILCKHCAAQFKDGQIMAFVRHLDQVHGVAFPLRLGDHGICTTKPRPVTPYPTSWETGEALRPRRRHD